MLDFLICFISAKLIQFFCNIIGLAPTPQEFVTCECTKIVEVCTLFNHAIKWVVEVCFLSLQ